MIIRGHYNIYGLNKPWLKDSKAMWYDMHFKYLYLKVYLIKNFNQMNLSLKQGLKSGLQNNL